VVGGVWVGGGWGGGWGGGGWVVLVVVFLFVGGCVGCGDGFGVWECGGGVGGGCYLWVGWVLGFLGGGCGFWGGCGVWGFGVCGFVVCVCVVGGLVVVLGMGWGGGGWVVWFVFWGRLDITDLGRQFNCWDAGAPFRDFLWVKQEVNGAPSKCKG